MYPPDLPRVVVAEGVGEVIRSRLRSTAARLWRIMIPLFAFLGSHLSIATVGGLRWVSVTAGMALMLEPNNAANCEESGKASVEEACTGKHRQPVNPK